MQHKIPGWKMRAMKMHTILQMRTGECCTISQEEGVENAEDENERKAEYTYGPLIANYEDPCT